MGSAENSKINIVPDKIKIADRLFLNSTIF